MTTVKVFNDQTEVQMAQGLLRAEGIDAQIVGSFEYVTHVTGGGLGRFELKVNAIDKLKAEEILRQVELNSSVDGSPAAPSIESQRKSEYSQHDNRRLFRKAVLTAVLAVVAVPLLFNVASINNARLFWASSDKSTSDLWRLLFICAMQIPGFAMAAFVGKTFLLRN